MSWPLRILRWTYCASIGWSSLQSLLQARAAHDDHTLLLSGAELLAIVAFLFQPLEMIACIVLLTIFAIAGAVTTFDGEAPLRFFYFGATAAFIVYASRAKSDATSTAID